MCRRMRHLKPREIQGCTIALDGSIETSLYDATSGGSLVAADGSVYRMEDQSGNSNHVTQSTTARCPRRRVAARGGMGAIQFSTDAASLMAAASYYPSSGAGDVTIISAGLPLTSGTLSCLWLYGENATGRFVSWYPRYNTTRSATSFIGSYIGNAAPVVTADAWHAHTYIASGATQIQDTSQRVNGASLAETYTSFPTTTLNTGTGFPFQISANTQRADYFAFVAAFSRALPAAVIARAEASVMRKWRING